MGCPSADDTHPLHGELPNAPYQSAELRVGECDRGEYIEMTGMYDHTIAFTCNLRATASIRFYADTSTFPISMTIENRFHTDSDLMYMAHTNFRPVVGAKLLYTHHDGPNDMEISGSVNGLQAPTPAYEAFLERLALNPADHAEFTPDVMANLNPEVLVYLRNYLTEPETKWAHTLQLLPGGTADYLAHRPDQLPLCTRWMVADQSQAALGMALPATAEPTGKQSEAIKGYLRKLPPQAKVRFDVEAGALNEADARAKADVIASTLMWHSAEKPT
jgi:hypothetical protein